MRNTLCSNRVSILETDCEILWVRINLQESKNLLVGGFYHPHTGDEHSYDELEASILKAANQNTNIWIAGDFNLPNVNWRTRDLKLERPSTQCRFIDIIDEKPARGNNILDLFLTNRSFNHHWDVIDGISDHNAVLTDGSLQAKTIQ